MIRHLPTSDPILSKKRRNEFFDKKKQHPNVIYVCHFIHFMQLLGECAPESLDDEESMLWESIDLKMASSYRKMAFFNRIFMFRLVSVQPLCLGILFFSIHDSVNRLFPTLSAELCNRNAISIRTIFLAHSVF